MKRGTSSQQSPGDSAANSEFTFDPTNKVAGSIDTADSVTAALRDLQSAGFPANEVELVADTEAARQISVDDATQEPRVHIFDAKQEVPAFYDAPVIVKRVAQELQAGHYLVGVVARDDETRERVRDILRSNGGHFINFYGRFAAESLEP
jgi:hypothetical protein